MSQAKPLKRNSTEKKTKTKDSSEKLQKKSKKSTTQEQEVSDEEQHEPEELHKEDKPVPESNAHPESNTTATPAKKGHKSKSEKLGNQLTKWFIDRKIQDWKGFVENLTDQEKKNISNLLKMSEEK